MASTIVDDNIVLIKEIKERHPLWNQFDPNYHNRDITDQMWRELSSKYSISVEQLKAKWIGLRSQFRKCYLRQLKFLKVNPGKKVVNTWRYFVPLLFLKNQMKKMKYKTPQQSDSTIDSDEEVVGEMMKEFETMEAEYEESNNTEFVQQINPTMPPVIDYDFGNQISTSIINSLLESFQKDLVALENEKIASIDESQTDEDLLFLHSLLPYMKSLSLKKKLILRTKIQSLICNFISTLDDKYFDAVVKCSQPKKGQGLPDSGVTTESDNIQIIYNSLATSPLQSATTVKSGLDHTKSAVSNINSAMETSDVAEFVSLNDENIMEDGIVLKYLKDDSCMWLLNVDEK